MRKTFSKHAANDNPKERNSSEPRIFLALQGGGSHGAFEAGVIEALQEADLLKHVKGISGTSAGAFNAAPLSYALNLGKPEMAPALVNKAWIEIAQSSEAISLMHSFARAASTMAPFFMTPTRYPNLPARHVSNLENAGHVAQAYGVISQSGDIKNRMTKVIPDWDVIKNGEIETIIAATEIQRVGPLKVCAEKLFYNADIDANAIAASATLIGTHEKDGAEYKDGGYTNNPPLQDGAKGDYTDIMTIMLSPRPDTPLQPQTQAEQVNAKNFLHDEVYNELALLTDQGDKFIHVIEMEHEPHWNETSKMNSEGKWIAELHKRGYEAGKDWIAKHAKDLGKRTTFDAKSASGQHYELDNPEYAVAL